MLCTRLVQRAFVRAYDTLTAIKPQKQINYAALQNSQNLKEYRLWEFQYIDSQKKIAPLLSIKMPVTLES